ncbi:UBP1-associated proteins 1C-like [Durio zibethinus]|uniref:UBP1-associated proteins 1C-like n=1 Tax=Durio zibethinus TaxID=66656 RepID=A0A6P5Y9E8_DURZI|nr:UBP1-associated proteins 1C-like [Durio zibethinus]
MAEKRASTMSLELAIQRELAYRRKIEELQLQPYVDLGDETMPMQVQFPSRKPSRPDQDSTPGLSGREHLASLSSHDCQPSPSPRPNQNPSSRRNICSSPRISERNQLASSSMSPSQQLQLFKGCNLNHQSLNFFCEVCQVPCSGSLNYKLHINGKKHKVKFQELKFARKDGNDTCAMANQKSWCKLCKIWCTDDNLLKQHLAGKKHKKMQEKLELSTTVEGDKVEEQNWCELCGIGCSSKELLQLHFNGKKHQAELRKLECGQKVGGEEAQNQPKRRKLCNTWRADNNSLQMHLMKKNISYMK